MDDFLGLILAVILFVYFLACAVAVPAFLIERYSDKRECEQAHNVFMCNVKVEWIPVGVKE